MVSKFVCGTCNNCRPQRKEKDFTGLGGSKNGRLGLFGADNLLAREKKKVANQTVRNEALGGQQNGLKNCSVDSRRLDKGREQYIVAGAGAGVGAGTGAKPGENLASYTTVCKCIPCTTNGIRGYKERHSINYFLLNNICVKNIFSFICCTLLFLSCIERGQKYVVSCE